MRLLIFACLLVVVYMVDYCHGDEDDIDPFDMVNFDSSNKKMKKKVQDDKSVDNIKQEKDEKAEDNSLKSSTTSPIISSTTVPPIIDRHQQTSKTSEKCSSAVLFKKFVRKFLSSFQGKAPDTTQEYHVWIKLSKDQYTILQKFSNDQSNVHDAQEILVSMIKDVTISNVGSTAKLSMWIEQKTGASLDGILKVVAVMVLVSVLLHMQLHLHIAWRSRVTQLIMLAFVISIPMTWYELYQTAQITQQTVAMKDAPKECVQNVDEGNLFSVYASAFKRIFTLEKDKCEQYHQHLLIDPFLKVTPTKAIAVTFVRFFLAPLKDVGTAFSEFIRALLIDLPLTLYPVAIGTLAIFLFLFLFMWFGYSIRLPFFLSIEPCPRVAVGVSTDNTQSIEDVKKQLETLQDSVKNSETNMADQIKRLGKIQTSAIEYTVSALTPNMPAPTLSQAISSRSDKSFQSSNEHDKSPIPCSDDSFSVVGNSGSDSVIQQVTTFPVDNIGPNS